MATVAIQLGIAVAGSVLNAVFAPKPPPQEGPRLNDLNLPAVNPGNPINRVYGRAALGTQVIWTTGLKETRHEKKVKGGKGAGPSQKVITYTYSTDVAVGVCEGPVTAVRRIWANNKILYQGRIFFGEDAILANQTASTIANLIRVVEAQRAKIDGKVKSSGKRQLRDMMATLTPGIETVRTNFETLGEDPGFFMDDYNAVLTWVEDTARAYDTGTTTYNEAEAKTLFDGLIGALETAEMIMRDGAAESDDAFIQDQAAANAEAAIGPQWWNNVPNDVQFDLARSFLKKVFQSNDEGKDRYDRINIYLGNEAQEPDDIIEADLGVGNVPAYRGLCYFVIDELQLADFGNTLPTFRVEVARGDENNKVDVRTIIAEECERAGLTSDEYDVRSVSPRLLDGVAVTRVSSARDVLEMVRNVVQFDCVESNFALKFVDRYRKPVARLRPEDLRAAEFDTLEPPMALETMRTQAQEMPREINFTYQDPTRDFSIGTARSKRAVNNLSNEVEQIELTIAMTPDVAKTAVDLLMVFRYASRRTHKVFLPIKYAILDPGDVILLPDPEGESPDRVLRITSMTIGTNHLIEMSMTDHVPPRSEIGSLAYFQPQPLEPGATKSDTYPLMLDLPILSETEDASVPGFYAGFWKDGTEWPGGALYLDAGSGGITPTPGGDVTDTGESAWEIAAVAAIDLPVMTLLEPLPAASPYLWDRTSSVVVFALTPDFVPTTQPESTLLRSPVNVCAINGEILQFATVEDLTNNLYRLSNFVRGLRGTEPMIAEHVAGSKLVVLKSEALKRVVQGSSLIGVEQRYIAANQGVDIGTRTPFNFANQGNSLRPYAPCQVRRRGAGGDITISWLPRVRQGGTWVDSVDVAVDQPTERYEIDIFTPNGVTLKRTLTVDGAREVVYTSAMQTADFGGPVGYGGMMVKAYQIGALVGRGFTNPIVL